MKINYMKAAIGCASLLVFGSLFGHLIFPIILKAILKSQLNLGPRTDIREMFVKIPFPLNFKIYVFNITNPEGVSIGEKPHVSEVGPFFFEEWKEKYDQVDDPVEDTLEFTLQNTFIFRPDLTPGITGDEEITILNPLLILTLIAVKRDREPMLPLVTKAMNIIFHQPEHIFIKVRVMDLLFNGIIVDCSSHEFAAKAVCSAWVSDGRNVKQFNETHVIFSFFGAKNATDSGRFLVYRGIKNIQDLGRIIKFNEETEMDVWDGDNCNAIIGTDSTIFPPFMTKEQGLWAFTPDICRSMGAQYIGKSSYSGLPTSEYKLDMGDIKNTEELHCFCRNPPDDCPLQGTMDLMPCLGAPLVASKPHFYEGHPSLIANVDGLNPNRHDHDIYIHFEIISGTPLSAAKRLQFNLDLEPIENMNITKDLPKVVLPMFWAEEGANLNKTYVNMLKYQLFFALKFNTFVKWVSGLIGTIGTLAAALMYYKNRTTIAKVTQAPDIGNHNDMVTVKNQLNGIDNPVMLPTISEVVYENNNNNIINNNR